MAFVAKPAILITYTFRDNDGKTSTEQVQIDGATAPADAVTFANSYRAVLAAMSDAVCTSQNVLIGSYDNAPAAPARSDVEDKGLFNFLTASGQRSSMAIPSIKETLLQANNQDIDGTLAAVVAFVNAMTLGLGGIQPAGAGGSDIVSVNSSYKQNRRSMLGRQSRVRKG